MLAADRCTLVSKRKGGYSPSTVPSKYGMTKTVQKKCHDQGLGKAHNSDCQSILTSEEHNHTFAHAQELDFWTGCREFKTARTCKAFSQIRLHRLQSALPLPQNFSESKISGTWFL